ncbi:hypothetical protein RyT2_06270 [Pseudolactococcus yaeyamensis]
MNKENFKFDVVIGNPPYQEESVGDSTQAPPIYHKFMDSAYQVADKVELITPARFLFNAGATGKAWNEKMLADEHLKVVYFNQNANEVFNNTDIKGGIAVTYRDKDKKFGAINTFTSFEELNTILHKVAPNIKNSFSEIIYGQNAYQYTFKLHEVYPKAVELLSKGHEKDITTNAFERLPFIYHDDKPNDEFDYIQIYGRFENDRVYKYVRKDFISEHENLNKYKVFLPKANGSGAIGEVLSTPLIGTPLIGTPLIGATQTFISIGAFDTEFEAQATLKYIKSKFARTMLGILKLTQDNPAPKWKFVPLQDFTANSDIDWSQSIPNIDKQLYKKYGLDDNEIEFIETKVKEMN